MAILAMNMKKMREHFDTCPTGKCIKAHESIYSKYLPDARPVQVFIDVADPNKEYDEFLVTNTTDNFYLPFETGWYRRGGDGEIYKVIGIWTMKDDQFTYCEILEDMTLVSKTSHDAKKITLDMLDTNSRYVWDTDHISRDDFIWLIKEVAHSN